MGGAKLLLALALVVTAFGLAACGGDDEDEGGTTTGAEETGTTAEEGGDPILIKTHLEPLKDPEEPTTGQVLPGVHHRRLSFLPGRNIPRRTHAAPGRGHSEAVPLLQWQPDDQLRPERIRPETDRRLGGRERQRPP